MNGMDLPRARRREAQQRGRVQARLSLLLVRAMAAVLLLGTMVVPVRAWADDTPSVLASRIAALAADPATARLNAGTVTARLRPIVSLEPDTPSEAERSFSGRAPDAGIAWARVDFQSGSRPGRWQFQQLQIGLDTKSAAGAALADALAAELTQRLGKAQAPPSGDAERRRIWRLSAHRVVSLRSGNFASPIDDRRRTVTVLELAVEQGEAE